MVFQENSKEKQEFERVQHLEKEILSIKRAKEKVIGWLANEKTCDWSLSEDSKTFTVLQRSD